MDTLVTPEQKVDLLEQRIAYLEKMTGHSYEENLADDIQRHKFTFEEAIDLIDGKSLQRIFREIDDATLAGCLFSLDTPERVDKIRKNLSKNHFNRLIEHITDYYGYIGSSRAKEEFIRIVSQLEEMGEVVLAREGTLVNFYQENPIATPSEPFDVEKYFADIKERRKKEEEIAKAKLKEWMVKVKLAEEV